MKKITAHHWLTHLFTHFPKHKMLKLILPVLFLLGAAAALSAAPVSSVGDTPLIIKNTHQDVKAAFREQDSIDRKIEVLQKKIAPHSRTLQELNTSYDLINYSLESYYDLMAVHCYNLNTDTWEEAPFCSDMPQESNICQQQLAVESRSM